MAPKKKRNSSSKSSRTSRNAIKTNLSNEQATVMENIPGDNSSANAEESNENTDLSTEQSIDCLKYNNSDNIDFEELISESVIHNAKMNQENAYADSSLHLPELQTKELESQATTNEIASKMSNLNVVEDLEQKCEEPEVYIEEAEPKIFNNSSQEFTMECITEDVIPVASEQEIVSISTNEVDDTIKDILQMQVSEKQETATKSEKKTKPSKKTKSSKSVKTGSSDKKRTTSTKPQKKESSKSKSKKATNTNSDNSETTDSSRRRSSRLKTITESKQNQVKSKSNKSCNDSDASDNSNVDFSDLDKVYMHSLNILASANYDSEQRPVKVKSRWRRSSELELVNNLEQEAEAEKLALNNEIIKKRLKQFVHLKENQYLTGRVTCKEAKKMACDCVLTAEEVEKGELGCGEDCLNRLLLIECGPLCPVGDKCTNKRFQKSQFSPSEVFCTEKKGLGIRATANIRHGEFILEYIGEVIGPDEFEVRATEYSKGKNPHYYFMSLRSDAVIDATQKGNISRFINHSCDPNAETQKWTVNGELRIGFFSKRTIIAGEEITFDYQFQRYGKEAQKCFCESSLCRGWLGEEPEDEEEEEEEEDETSTEIATIKTGQKLEEQSTKQVTSNDLPPSLLSEVNDDQQPPILEPAINKVAEPCTSSEGPPPLIEIKPLVVKKEKKKVIKRKVLKDMFEDVDVDGELQMLVTTGLKNQSQTLKLSRLMVRATEVSQRITLLRVLRRGEFPCRRLFLDYHGLRLIHGWMNEAQQLCPTNDKREALRLALLQTLVTLPIPNKTMLQDSKVLPTVELWSKKLVYVPPEVDSESNSPKLETEINASEVPVNKPEPLPVIERMIPKKEEDVVKENLELEPDQLEPLPVPMPDDLFEIRKSVGMDIENIRSENFWRAQEDNNKLIQDIIDMFDDDMDISPVAFNEEENDVKSKIEETKQEGRNYEAEIIMLAQKLLEEWSVLKEVFRIPKKERIEQMKEHEREADRGYRAGLENYFEKRSGSSRYRLSQRCRIRKKEDSYHSGHTRINKHERRKLFAMQVEQEEVERRFKSREMWRHSELPCISTGNDVFPSAYDSRNYQLMWNQQSNQWQNFPIMNSNIQPRFNMGMNYPYQIPNSVGNVNLGLPNVSQSMANLPPPSVPNLNMSMPPPNLVHLHRPPIMSNTLLGITPNASQNSYSQVPNIPIPTNMPPPAAMALPTNIPPPTIPTNIPPPNMQPQSNLNVSNPMPALPPLPNGPPPISNITTHLSSQETSYKVHQDKFPEAEVKFAGPIPPPVKLPPKWKCAKDKYGRPYYYHIQIRISQWEPPDFPLRSPLEDMDDESTDSTSSSDTSSLSSSSCSEDSDEDELNDTKLLMGIRKKFQSDPTAKQVLSPQVDESPEDLKDQSEVVVNETKPLSLDERLKDEFHLIKKEPTTNEPPRKKRAGLVTEVHIISPRTEEDKLIAKENLRKYKETKEKLKRQKDLTLEQNKKRVKVTLKNSKSIRKHKGTSKTKLKEAMDLNCEAAKRIKETFRSSMAGVMVGILNPYRKPDCKEGRITNTEDFKHLARKLTHFVMLKELKHCQNIEDLTCTESVKSKAKEFVRKYMSKFGEIYHKPKDDIEY